MSLKKLFVAGCLSVFCLGFIAGCASESTEPAGEEVTETVEVEETNSTSPE